MLYAVAGDLCARRENPFYRELGKRRGVDGRAVPALLGEPQDRLQMAAALPAAELGRFAGPLPGAATPSRSDRGRDRARDSRSAGAAQSLGCGHLEGAAAAKAARRGMAGGEHDRKSAATTRSERAPTTPAPRRTDPAAADARQAAQPGLVRRLQRLVSHPRRPALRSLNDLGRGQPLPVAVPRR